MEQIIAVPLWASVPFGLMLLSIAIGPLLFEHWWEKNLNKLLVALALGIPTAAYLMMNNMTTALEHQLLYDKLI